MSTIRFVAAALATTALIWVLDRPLTIGEVTLPPLGRFFSPHVGCWQNAEPVLSTARKIQLDAPALSGPLDIYLDKEWVPRIFADNDRDAAFAQGYMSAYLRLFQMDLSARAPVGRLSELFGERTLENDRLQRRKGLLAAAERLAADWQSDSLSRMLLAAFVDGVNARIAELEPADLPLEYKLLDIVPEAWTPVHCAAFYLAMSETLARTAHDIPLTNARVLTGPEDFELLFPDRNPQGDPVIPDEAGAARSAPAAAEEVSGALGWFSGQPAAEPSRRGVGSNNWAVAPSKTLNGHALLCNDPHLALTLPSIWLEMQITTPGYSAYGVAFTCLPGIAIGFNQDIAWGFTNAGHDVLDWYTIDWVDDEKTRYRLDGEVRDAILREERIVVRGRPAPVRDTVRYTHWGPVPQLDNTRPNADLAMHWLPVQELDPLMPAVFHQINQSRNLEDWLKPLFRYDAPMQNGLAASRTGDIGLRISGKLPMRPAVSGRLVQDGGTQANGWQGFVPADENPMAINPPQGFLCSANQESTNGHYPFPYTGVFEAWRGRYVNEQLRDGERFTLDQMMALQQDNTSLLAREAIPVFRALLDESALSPEEQKALKRLQSWDCRFDAEAREPVLFSLWLDAVEQLAWDEFFTVRAERPVEVPEDWRLITLMRDQPQLKWWDIRDTPETEQAADLVRLGLSRAVHQMDSLKQDGTETWGRFQGTTIRHIARIDAFSEHHLEIGGHPSALNAISRTNGPSWRMVVELGPQIRAFGIYPGGQSGNPGSPHYHRFIPIWQKGEYRKLRLLSREEAAADGFALHFQNNGA